MEERPRARCGDRVWSSNALSWHAAPPDLHVVTSLEALRLPSLLVSLHRHSWLNRWQLAITSISSPSPLPRGWWQRGTESLDPLITCLAPPATNPHPLAVSKSCLITNKFCPLRDVVQTLGKILWSVSWKEPFLFSTTIRVYLCLFLALNTYSPRLAEKKVVIFCKELFQRNSVTHLFDDSYWTCIVANGLSFRVLYIGGGWIS